jgi:hypothetical protein
VRGGEDPHDIDEPGMAAAVVALLGDGMEPVRGNVEQSEAGRGPADVASEDHPRTLTRLGLMERPFEATSLA